MRPAVGSVKPPIMRRQVVLPEPEGPSSVKNSPEAIVRSTPSTARTADAPLPKTQLTCSSVTAAVIVVRGPAGRSDDLPEGAVLLGRGPAPDPPSPQRPPSTAM